MFYPSILGEYLIVAFLLLCGPAHEDHEYQAMFDPSMTEPLRIVAIALECLDPSERENYFANQHSIGWEMQNVRQRLEQLQGAPPDCDKFRYIHLNTQYLQECMTFNRKYYEYLNIQQSMHWNKDAFDAPKQETQLLYRIYEKLSCIANQHSMIYDRRTYLKELKELMGEMDYYSGQIPPHVPIWRFREIN